MTEVTTTAVTSTSATTTVTTSAVPERKLTKHELIANFIKENKLDAGVYELPVRNAGYTYAIVYYETDSDIPEKIKAFLKENDISESYVTFKPRKGEKPDGGMITDAKEIVRKLDECIWDNRLPAVIKIWLGGKEIFYDAYTVRRISFPVIDLIDTEKVDAIIIDCLQTDHIVYETIDEMFARENIDPSIVKYYLMQNGERGMAGDANCDGTLNMADAVLIMQLIANPDRFDITGTDPGHITVEGKANADIAGDNDGITALDALAIQKHLLGLT